MDTTPTITDTRVLRAAADNYLADAGQTRAELIEELIALDYEDELTPTLDGCYVEPDGHCPHGYPSWLLYLGMI